MYLEALEEFFSLGGNWVEHKEAMVCSKTVREYMNLKFRSKFNPVFINHGCLHSGISITYTILRKKEPTRLEIFLSLSISLSKWSKLDFLDFGNV